MKGALSMEQLQLLYFQKVALSENITKTAKELYITPSALSMSITRLEKELEVELFDRKGNRIVLNDTGKKFLFHANRILEDIDLALHEIQSKDEKTIRLATTSPAIWANLFNKFQLKFPGSKISQKTIHIDELPYIDLRNSYDFLLASSLDFDFEPPKNYNVSPIYTDDFPMLLVWENHPFAKRDHVNLLEAKNEVFVALPQNMSSRKLFDYLCHQAGFIPNIGIECDYMMRAKLVANHTGIALATARTRDRTQYEGCCFVNISAPKFNRDQNIYWDQNRPLSSNAKKFLKTVNLFY